MQKPICFLFLFLSLCGAAAADTIGLRAGVYADTPDLTAEEQQFFISPQLEYEQSFGNFDVYAGGEYTFSLGKLYPRFFFAEERLGFRLPLGTRSEFRIGLRNENDLRFQPDRDGGEGGGRVKPEVSYGLFLRPGDFSLALGAPLSYPLWGGEAASFGVEATAAYVTPFWLGFEAMVNLTAAPAAAFEGMKFAVNYTGDQFYGELALRAKESFSDFSLRAEFNYFFNFLIPWGALEAGNLTGIDAISLGAAIGIKYRF
ncbi:MAG: hypothetical protein LBB68_07245 [Treponema sp.]|jgi:hypothetical protein|nr:hypothetical protein [Treponema sp.]